MTCAAIILGAGKGTRMSSDRPKVLHEIEGRPMVSYVIDAVRPLCRDRVYLVVGYKAEDVIEACAGEKIHFVTQAEQLGTGHAVMQCENALRGFSGTVVVLNGDVPCLRAETIRAFCQYHGRERAEATVLTAILPDPRGYGRVLRDGDGSLRAIVEDRDADDETKKIREINSGLFCFERAGLFDALKSTDCRNVQGEYYLTDVIGVLRNRGKRVCAYRVKDAWEVSGVNTDEELDAVRDYIRG